MQKKRGSVKSLPNHSSKFGYWKGSGKDRHIKYKEEMLGVMKTLVFYCGKSPKGERTNWVIHEYSLGKGVQNYVICVVFQKDGFGRTKGFQYAASASVLDAFASVLDASSPVVPIDVPESMGAPQVPSQASQVEESLDSNSDSLVGYLNESL
ncbi:No apical meristem (NAM) protein [Corchorus capsularis]|uniref:No apical meristem (NAM) protein n=1 Tax=Corchorus capsularis TaxID=210143 RepID=A0A1R3GMC7_COCAP|nr:No apical meristem (NAM) protein [Corchorus capsularis]